MNAPEYPFDEFMRHTHEVTAHLESEKAARGPDLKEDGSVPFEWTVIRVFEYMKPHYPDERERQYKIGRFCLIMQYVSENIATFDTGDFAVYGSAMVGGLVGEHLFRAVHHLFTTRDLGEMGDGPSPQEVMELAARFKEEPSADP
jgi:hypothetical protein